MRKKHLLQKGATTKTPSPMSHVASKKDSKTAPPPGATQIQDVSNGWIGSKYEFRNFRKASIKSGSPVKPLWYDSP